MTDLICERAEKVQKKYNILTLYGTMQKLFCAPEIDIVLNLTYPYKHYGDVSLIGYTAVFFLL